MAIIVVDDPKLETWLLEVLEAAAQDIVVGYGSLSEMMPLQQELYIRLGIVANLVKGDMEAVWKEEKGCWNFRAVPKGGTL